jgi:hypothetical protein
MAHLVCFMENSARPTKSLACTTNTQTAGLVTCTLSNRLRLTRQLAIPFHRAEKRFHEDREATDA